MHIDLTSACLSPVLPEETRGQVQLHHSSIIRGAVRLIGPAYIYNSSLEDQAVVENCMLHRCEVHGDAEIRNVTLQGASILGGAYINSSDDVLVVGVSPRFQRIVTVYKDRYIGVAVTCGCFHGTLTAFEEAIRNKHEVARSKDYFWYMRVLEMARGQFG